MLNLVKIPSCGIKFEEAVCIAFKINLFFNLGISERIFAHNT